ncbi:MAG TPA: DUF3592 domain-containing protein [Firmicutes bacterium]|nr:DUF3592 domain-containing protein [Bacillota bacterium]
MQGGAKIISSLLIAVCLIAGVIMLSLGISDTLELSKSTKGYEITTGYFSDYSLYSEGGYDAARKTHTSDTYSLTYNYNVDGREYTITTDYGTSFVPEKGSEREIRYNPDAPSEAVIVGSSSGSILIFMGLFFIIIPVIILSAMLGWLQRLPSRLVPAILGLILIFVSYGALYMIAGSLSPAKIFKYFTVSFSLPLIIPIIMIAAGIYLLIKGIFFSKSNETE